MSIVVPVYNAEDTLPVVLSRLPALVSQVVLVDAGCTDRTVAVARELRPDVLVVRSATGTGDAVRRGLAVCTSDIVVTLDPTGAADPADLPRFVDALLSGADLVTGTRYADADRADTGGPADAYLSLAVRLLFHTRITDLRLGYHAAWRWAWQALDLPEPPGPADSDQRRHERDIDAILQVRAVACGLRVVEVGTTGLPRPLSPGQSHRAAPALRILRAVVREHLRRRPVNRHVPRHAAADRPRADVPAVEASPSRRATDRPTPTDAGHRGADLPFAPRSDRPAQAATGAAAAAWRPTPADRELDGTAASPLPAWYAATGTAPWPPTDADRPAEVARPVPQPAAPALTLIDGASGGADSARRRGARAHQPRHLRVVR